MPAHLLSPPEPHLLATWSPGDAASTVKGNIRSECGGWIPNPPTEEPLMCSVLESGRGRYARPGPGGVTQSADPSSEARGSPSGPPPLSSFLPPLALCLFLSQPSALAPVLDFALELRCL